MIIPEFLDGGLFATGGKIRRFVLAELKDSNGNEIVCHRQYGLAVSLLSAIPPGSGESLRKLLSGIIGKNLR
jgi:hypothetical protein